MGYQFSGFFAVADELALKKALEQWPFCKGKLIKSPFSGIGISCPLYPILEDYEGQETQQIKRVRSELPSWSKTFPNINFVFIQVECWAGSCNYWGYVCNNGNITLNEVYEDDEKMAQIRLLNLLSHLGVHQANFEPFYRGYFDNDSDNEI